MRAKRQRRWLIGLGLVCGLLVVWLFFNPPGRFGWSTYAYTTFGAIPRPIGDFQVRADGEIRKIEKTHILTFEEIRWLVQSDPEVLIISLGWHGIVSPDDEIREYDGCEVHLLENEEAIELFNRLRREGKRVAVHYHSTC